MPVIRTYHCDDCRQSFEVTQNMADEAPDCPTCSQVLEWTPKSFSINTSKASAIDVTQDILEKDFGMTDFNDNMREGDIAAKATPEKTTVQRDAEFRTVSELSAAAGQPMSAEQANMAQSFWGGGAGKQPMMPQVSVSEMLGNARQSALAADAEGVNPMKLLHERGKKGGLKVPIIHPTKQTVIGEL